MVKLVSSFHGLVVAVVKVKSHYQVTLPPKIRAKAVVSVGDLYEAKV